MQKAKADFPDLAFKRNEPPSSEGGPNDESYPFKEDSPFYFTSQAAA